MTSCQTVRRSTFLHGCPCTSRFLDHCENRSAKIGVEQGEWFRDGHSLEIPFPTIITWCKTLKYGDYIVRTREVTEGLIAIPWGLERGLFQKIREFRCYVAFFPQFSQNLAPFSSNSPQEGQLFFSTGGRTSWRPWLEGGMACSGLREMEFKVPEGTPGSEAFRISREITCIARLVLPFTRKYNWT